jgi:hypothetical protein
MKLSQTRKIRSATIDLGEGLSFTFQYRSCSPEEFDEIDRESKSDDWPLLAKLEKVISEIGIEDDDGVALPPNRDGLRKLETPILIAMWDQVLQTTLPKKAT